MKFFKKPICFLSAMALMVSLSGFTKAQAEEDWHREDWHRIPAKRGERCDNTYRSYEDFDYMDMYCRIRKLHGTKAVAHHLVSTDTTNMITALISSRQICCSSCGALIEIEVSSDTAKHHSTQDIS